jgi:hypothetical protein
MEGAELPAGLLIVFDAAAPLLRFRPRAPLVSRLYCLGFPTLQPEEHLRARLARSLGVPVERWPVEITSKDHVRAFQLATERTERYARMVEPHAEVDWVSIKGNDRVVYRAKPVALLELLLDAALSSGLAHDIVIPWRTSQYDLVERSGMFGLDAPAHMLAAMLDRLAGRHAMKTHTLWQGVAAAERLAIAASVASMASARSAVLLGRSLRATIRPRVPLAASRGSRLGFIIGGAPHWQNLAPLLRLAEERTPGQCVVYAHDIFRNPTAYRILQQDYPAFVPLDQLVRPTALARLLFRSLRQRSRIARDLAERANGNASMSDKEGVLLLRGDADALPELEAFTAQLRAAIRRDRLGVVISANCIDSYLSATTAACHHEGVPHVCVQTAAVEHSPMPRLGDCDVYFADSKATAEFLLAQGAPARVMAVGLPYYDTLLARRRDKAPGVVRQSFPELAGKRIVGILTQTAVADMAPMIARFVEWAKGRDDVGVVIKLHPRESAGAYAELADDLRRAKRGGRIHQVPVVEFLADCSSVVSSTSATILWSLVMGVRPFSCLDVAGIVAIDALSFMNPRVTTRTANLDELIAAVEKDLVDGADHRAWKERHARFLQDFVTGADGRACERILEAIHLVVGSQTDTPVASAAAD